MKAPFEIIDISQPISRKTACFPGDVPFSREITVNYQESSVMNLGAFTMSPHVGTHADAPVHIHGDMDNEKESVGALSLSPFIGPCAVVDVSPWHAAIGWEQVWGHIALLDPLPPRILFKTQPQVRYDVFEKQYAWFGADLVQALAERGVVLMGLDTPSVDAVDSKTLETHHAMLAAGMCWLENLDLSQVPFQSGKPEEAFLVAPPLKLMEMEASPVRAVLLKSALGF